MDMGNRANWRTLSTEEEMLKFITSIILFLLSVGPVDAASKSKAPAQKAMGVAVPGAKGFTDAISGKCLDFGAASACYHTDGIYTYQEKGKPADTGKWYTMASKADISPPVACVVFDNGAGVRCDLIDLAGATQYMIYGSWVEVTKGFHFSLVTSP